MLSEPSCSAEERYAAYIEFDHESRTERGVQSSSSRLNNFASYRLVSSGRNGTSYVTGQSMRGLRGSSVRCLPNSHYDMLGQSLIGSFLNASDTNIVSGAGGASARAGLRRFGLEGSSNGNMSHRSYRFYPADDDNQDGRASPVIERLSGGDGSNRREVMKRYQQKREAHLKQNGGERAHEAAEEAKEEKCFEFVALSPDALSAFSKEDTDRAARNQEVHDATCMMMEYVVPLVANHLVALPPAVQETLDLTIELHRHGVNMRHLGKLRSLIAQHEDQERLRDTMLTEMVARTLKNILRSFQRGWMKAERSTSEQGMRMLVVEFLNLVTGAHVNSKQFWNREVLVGILQRFGVVALTSCERENIMEICTIPGVLKTCVFKLTEMQGLVLTPNAEQQFDLDDGPRRFKFVVSDIKEIRPIVRYMHILDYGGGVMLSMQAQKINTLASADRRIVDRLNLEAKQCFITAYQSLPDDKNTRSYLLSYSESLRAMECHGGAAAGSTGGEGVGPNADPERRDYTVHRGEVFLSGSSKSTKHLRDTQGYLRRMWIHLTRFCSGSCMTFASPQVVEGPAMRMNYSYMTHVSGPSISTQGGAEGMAEMGNPGEMPDRMPWGRSILP